MKGEVIAFAPASVANVGPFYDVMGYCLNHLGDIVMASKTDKHREPLLHKVEGKYAQDLVDENVTNETNCVQIVAKSIWENFGQNNNYGIDLTLYKMMPTQSGLGSSAASCVASAKAMFSIMGLENKLNYIEIANAIISGEKESSDNYYPDNVVPSYWGGFNIISHSWMQKISVKNFHTLVILQNCKKNTKFQREAVDKYFFELITGDFTDDYKIEKILNIIRYQARGAGGLIEGLKSGNFEIAGRCISQSKSNFLEEARRDSIPNYDLIKDIALKEGAFGCSISGSGPAIFITTENQHKAKKIRDKIITRIQDSNVRWLISTINNQGAKIIEEYENWQELNRVYHNFW